MEEGKCKVLCLLMFVVVGVEGGCVGERVTVSLGFYQGEWEVRPSLRTSGSR